MTKRIKAVALLMLVVFTINLCSCQNRTEEIKERFEQYSPDHDVVAVVDDFIVCFADHTLNLRDLVNEDEEPNNGYLFWDKTLYFSTTKENGPFDFSVFVYRCDLYGNNKTLVFEKQGYKTHPWAVGNKDTLYFEHYTNVFEPSARVIESYHILTGLYEVEGTGKNVDLSDYQQEQSGVSQDDITDAIALTKDFFSEALNGLNYSYTGCKVSSGRLFLIYRIEESAGSLYPHFVCEYVPETEEIYFKSLVFAHDIESIDVEYIGTAGTVDDD